MFQKIVDFFRIVPNLRKLHKAEHALEQGKFQQALSILDRLEWRPIAIDVKIMKAEALIGEGRHKEAAILLAKITQDIENSISEENTRKYLQVFCIILLQRAVKEYLSQSEALVIYDTIELGKVSRRIKRQFPVAIHMKK